MNRVNWGNVSNRHNTGRGLEEPIKCHGEDLAHLGKACVEYERSLTFRHLHLGQQSPQPTISETN